MGPKTPKGKNKATKEEPVKDPDEATELEKEFYEFQLSEIEKKLGRITQREEELMAETVDFEQKIEEFKKEKGATVTELEQLLTLKEEEKSQKREEMCDLADEIKIRIVKHKKHIEDLEESYNKMVADLTEKITEQEEEIRTQEDFKQNKDLYEGKIDELEREMKEAELQHQRNLYQIEKKFQVAKKRVKKELQIRLIHLSIEFQETTKKKIGKPCHRATQENKAIQNALLQMEEEIIEYQNRCLTSKNNMTLFKSQKDKKQLDKDKMIARTLIQVSVIQTLKEDRAKLIEKLKSYDVVEIENKNLLKKLNFVTNEVENMENKIKHTGQKIKNKIEDTDEVKDAMKYLKKSFRRIQVLLRNAYKLAEEAMAVRLIPLGEMEEERFMPTDVKIRLFKNRRDAVFAKKGKILRYLLEFLSKGQLTEEDKKFLTVSGEIFEIGIDFTEVFGKPESEESEESKTSLEEDVEKGPIFLTSLTSMPRSVTTMVKAEKRLSELEIYGEMEEDEGEGEEEEQVIDNAARVNLEFLGEDFDIIEEEEEEDEKDEGGNDEKKSQDLPEN